MFRTDSEEHTKANKTKKIKSNIRDTKEYANKKRIIQKLKNNKNKKYDKYLRLNSLQDVT